SRGDPQSQPTECRIRCRVFPQVAYVEAAASLVDSEDAATEVTSQRRPVCCDRRGRRHRRAICGPTPWRNDGPAIEPMRVHIDARWDASIPPAKYSAACRLCHHRSPGVKVERSGDLEGCPRVAGRIDPLVDEIACPSDLRVAQVVLATLGRQDRGVFAIR